jgi:hypothetical protein
MILKKYEINIIILYKNHKAYLDTLSTIQIKILQQEQTVLYKFIRLWR